MGEGYAKGSCTASGGISCSPYDRSLLTPTSDEGMALGRQPSIFNVHYSLFTDTAGELPIGAILSEGRYSPTWRYGFYVEHGCGGLACWFRMHAARLIDQKMTRKAQRGAE